MAVAEDLRDPLRLEQDLAGFPARQSGWQALLVGGTGQVDDLVGRAHGVTSKDSPSCLAAHQQAE